MHLWEAKVDIAPPGRLCFNPRMPDWLHPRRVPQPELSDGADFLEPPPSPAAQAHAAALDSALLARARALLGPAARRVLVVGCGDARLCLDLVRRLSGLEATGVDLSSASLEDGLEAVRSSGLVGRVWLLEGDARRLEFPGGSFDLVIADGLLHHLPSPVETLGEFARVAGSRGLVLLRDLRRPSRLALPWILWRSARLREGRARALFEASLRAAYTEAELERLLRRAGLGGATIFRFDALHLGVVGGPARSR